jgi:hypothetical protein
MRKELHYQQGRDIQEIRRSQIEAICCCGYLTLKPTNDFEGHNGGLTVKRSKVKIVDDQTGNVVQRLRGVRTYESCNACVNNWK